MTDTNQKVYQYLTQTIRGSKKVDYDQVFKKSVEPVKRQTKIICTIGPACSSVETLVEMLDAGMNVARLDLSQGNHFEKSLKMKNLRMAMTQRPEHKCAVMLDLKGPEIRTTAFANLD